MAMVQAAAHHAREPEAAALVLSAERSVVDDCHGFVASPGQSDENSGSLSSADSRTGAVLITRPTGTGTSAVIASRWARGSQLAAPSSARGTTLITASRLRCPRPLLSWRSNP